MLITPIRPKMMVSPSAISTNTENSENPLKTCITKISKVIASLPVVARWRATWVEKGAQPIAPDPASQFWKRIRLDRRGLINHVDLALSIDGADACALPQVMVVLVDLDLAFRRIEGQFRRCRDHRWYIEAARFFHRFLPQVNRGVGRRHRVADDAFFAVTRLESRNEFLVDRVLQALEIAHAGQETRQVFRANTSDFLFSHSQSHQRLVAAVDACSLELFVKRHVGTADDGRKNDVRLGGLDLVDHRRELDIAQRQVILTDNRAALLGHRCPS